MIRARIKSELLTWARERARLELADLSNRFPKLEAWEEGTVRPTLKQVEAFAKATHATAHHHDSRFIRLGNEESESVSPRWHTPARGGTKL